MGPTEVSMACSLLMSLTAPHAVPQTPSTGEVGAAWVMTTGAGMLLTSLLTRSETLVTLWTIQMKTAAAMPIR